MKQYINLIKNTTIFDGINESEIESVLKCLSVTTQDYSRGEFIFRFGDKIESIGLVLEGAVNISYDDFWGNSNIITKISKGDFFAETYALVENCTSNINAISTLSTKVMFFNVKKLLDTCSPSCTFHTRLIRNLLSMMAQKNLHINEKLRHVTKRTTKEKLLSYLSSESKKAQSSDFDIPFNRQQLADYLSVDRSALSNELSKMQKDGILEFDKSHFRLNDIDYSYE